MLSFINGSMATSTQRFLTIEIGKKNDSNLQTIFSTAIIIHFIIALIILFLSETIGIWFLNQKLNIPENRMIAANWIFQFSILTCCLNVIQVPYNALIMAHEKMNIYAYISVIEVVLKLLGVISLSYITYDKLITYALIIFSIQFLIRTIYQIYCKKKFKECRINITKDLSLYKRMTNFAGWNLLGSLAWLLRDQGVNIILNIFFGPTINAAKGIATQVSGAIMGFISNFQTALNPPIIKYYAIGEKAEMEKLAYRGIKFSFCILFVITFPVILNINYILNLWLTEVPQFANQFIVLILIDSLVGILFGNPLTTSLSATGKIKTYQIIVSMIICAILPISYFLLKFRYDVTSVFYAIIAISFISGLMRFYFCKKLIGYSTTSMIKNTIFPILKLIIISTPLPLILNFCWNINHSIKFIGLSIISITNISLTIWFIVLSQNERKTILSIIKQKMKK